MNRSRWQRIARAPIPVIAAMILAIACAAPLRAQERRMADSSPLATFNRALEDATRRMDNNATLALWDDAGVSLMPSAAALVGKKAIADFFTSVTARIAGSRMEHFELVCFDGQTSGTWGSEWCVEHQVVRLADKTTFDGWGKLALVLQQAPDGRWRMTQEAWLPASASDSLLTRP
jgi:ketosteroid isomerase-like protein